MVNIRETLARGSNRFGGVRLVAYPCSVLLVATSVLAFALAVEGGPRAKAPSFGNVRLQPPAQVAALDGWLPPGRLNETANYYKAHGALFALLTRLPMEQWLPPSMATSFVGLRTGRTVMGR